MKFPSFRGSVRACIQAMFVACLLLQVTEVCAQLDPTMATGSTSSTYRKQAAARIPYQKMSPAVRHRVADVVNNASLYRQLPITTIQSDPDMYLFLLRYPETIIDTWRLMGITEMNARRTAPFRLQAADGSGTTTTAELVYGDPTMNIYYAEGAYDGPMIFRKVQGSCVIMVESNYNRGRDGKVHVTSRMNFFLKIDNLAASIIAKTVHPLVGTTADHNFVETLKFAEKLSQTSERNGRGVQHMADRLESLNPEVRQQFQEIAGVVWERSNPELTSRAATVQTAYSQSTSPAGYRQHQISQYKTTPARQNQASAESAQISGETWRLGDTAPLPPSRRYGQGR